MNNHNDDLPDWLKDIESDDDSADQIEERIEFNHGPNRRAFVMFHLPLQFTDLILQLPACALEGVVDGKIQIGIAFVILRGMANDDLASFGQREPDVDFVQAALLVMSAGGLEHHAACDNPAKPLFQLADMLDDAVTHAGIGGHALKIDLDGRFHDS